MLDIATLSGTIKRVNGQASVAGVTLVDGETAELVDCHALFAQQMTSGARARTVTCRLVGEDGWMRSFLGPIVEAASYRIAAEGEAADIAFVEQSADARAQGDARRAIRLSDDPAGAVGPDSVYRYDRAA